jgi:hypothetical protein
MANQTNILVKDDAGTPVEATLIPVSATPSPNWRGSAAGVPFEGQIRLGFSEEKLKSGDYKRTVKLEVPVMETLGASGTSAGYVAPPKVAYTEQFFATHISNRRATVADRANILKMMVGVLQGASGTTATGVLDQASSGGAFAASTLPAPLFYTQGVIPS